MRTVRAFRSKRDRRYADPAAPDDLARNGRDRHWPGARSIILDGVTHSYSQAHGVSSPEGLDPADEIAQAPSRPASRTST
ncbi:MAG: hypothetical protein OXF61_11320, partial [Acidimicrobiaceae bacterium]|nr:hypothetical protein [Acidimicrobiaceae bacterium]